MPASNPTRRIFAPLAAGVSRLARVTALAAMAFLAVGVALVAAPGVRPAHAQAATNITVNASTGSSATANRVYDGVGGVLAGGANARYLMDYPATERSEILDYLFKPDYGAALQSLKLEVGAGANSTDGSEPSVEPVKGQINCNAGFSLSIGQQAVARNPGILLYGLQWAAPSWVNDGTNSIFTSDDIQYLLDWLGCAKQRGLTISYLGGWNEDDNGSHAAWFASLRSALNSNGYTSVKIIAGDDFAVPPTSSQPWEYTGTTGNDAAVDTLGSHDICGYPTGSGGAQTQCQVSSAAESSGKPLWASELGGNDSGAGPNCAPAGTTCAPAMARSIVRGYQPSDGSEMTGYLEWPVIDSMPAGLPYEDAGLVTADQPWTGNYTVDAQTWAIAHFTQFASPGWHYLDAASGYLQGNRADGAYNTLVSANGSDWSSVVETTTGVTAAQDANFTVTGGAAGLSGKTVHVWASNFSSSNPADWFNHVEDITPSGGTFSLTIQPGYVYSLTTTTGQSKGAAAGPNASPLALPYSDSLATSGSAGSYDNEPELLAPQDGQFELAPCKVADGSNTTCTQQNAQPVPVVWRYCDGSVNPSAGTACRYPYATLGEGSWTDYTVSTDVLYTQANTTAGLIGRFSNRVYWEIGWFNGYMFDVSSNGAWKIIKNNGTSGPTTLATGTTTAPGTGSWHRLSMTLAGSTVTGFLDGHPVGSASDGSYTSGQAGIEAGAFSQTWPQVQYSNLSVTPANSAVASGIAGKCIDDRGASSANGTVIEIYTCAGSSNEQWTAEPDGTYRLYGKCLDITGAGTANGTKAELYTCVGGAPNQQWQQRGNQLYNPASGRCLDDPGQSTTDGTQLDIWDCVSQANEAWYPPQATPTTGAVTSGMSGKCLDDYGGSAANGTKADIYTCNNTAAQQWTLEGDGTIRSASGACLDVTGAVTANGTKAELYACTGGAPNQQWRALGSHQLVSTASGKCLDDPGESTTDGTQLDIWTCVNQPNEYWYPPTS
jgi:hypothetical protein